MKSIFQKVFRLFTGKSKNTVPRETNIRPTRNKVQGGSLLPNIRIKLPANTLLNEKVVFYYEKTPTPLVRQTLELRYHEIADELQTKGLHLLYLPALCNKQQEPNEAYGNLPFLSSRPELYINGSSMNPREMEGWLAEIDPEGITDFISKQLSFPEMETPCLLHCIDIPERLNNRETFNYSCVPLDREDAEKLNRQLDEYLKSVVLPHPSQYIQFSKGRRSSIDEKRTFLEQLEEVEKPYDADRAFFEDGSVISHEMRQKIEEVKHQVAEGKALETLLYIVKQFSEVNPELCRNICKQLVDAATSMEIKTSRLHIDSNHKIFLTDYQNLEIEMTALPKTLFIFLLKHPEGILFKQLYQHKWELMHIYGQVGNRSDIEQISKSINDLANAQSNSVNEKCSRIKEAFLSKLDESLAQPYIVTGGRSLSKLIKLDRSLVTMHHAYKPPKF